MALDLVTTEEAKAQLRIDDDAHDTWLALMIEAVSRAVLSWLKDEWRLYLPELDSDGEAILDSEDEPVPSEEVNPAVKGAILIELASQFRFREGDGDNQVPSQDGHGYTLSRGATSMLAGLRKPTVV